MRVKSIRLRGVTVYRDATLDLPDTGVVLVTGNNGAGKSSFIEGVPMAIWGTTLRGTSCWSPDLGYREPKKRHLTCAASVDVGGTVYTRTQTGRSGTISWDQGPVYESRREAAPALEERFGTFEDWRRAHVLSSHDAATFTAATDAQRKRMVEQIAGVDRYDAALANVKDKAKELQAALGAQKATTAGLEQRIATLDHVLQEVPVAPREPVAPPEQPPGGPRDSMDLEGLVEEYHRAARHVESATEECRRLADRRSTAKANADHQRERYDLLQQGACPTCRQDITEETASKADHQMAEAAQVLAKAIRVAESQERAVKELRKEARRLQGEVSAANKAAQEAQMARRVWERDQAHYERAQQQYRQDLAVYQQRSNRRQKLEQERAALTEQLAKAKATQEHLSSEHAHHMAATQVLGLRGVRAHLVGHALAGIEQAANAWLTRICGDRISIKLSATSVGSTGRTKNEVSLEVLGAGGGHGYLGASGGERRRIDVAIMLALAQVAEAATGRTGGTIFGDEAFDALDAEGVVAVGAALRELAQDRCVVVIAHTAVRHLLPYADMHVQAKDGELRCT